MKRPSPSTAASLSIAVVAALFYADPARGGGGVSTERYVNEVFDFAMSYPAAWRLVEDGEGGALRYPARRQPGSPLPEGTRTEIDACARLAGKPGSCRSVRVGNGASPESWVEAVFVLDETVGDLDALRNLARLYEPSSPTWERLGENRYAEGWAATGHRDADATPALKSEGFTNAYLPSPGLAVFLRGRAYEKDGGVLGIHIVKDSVARASRGPRLLGVRVESPRARVGRESCYLLDVQDVAGSFSPKTVQRVHLSGESTPMVPRRVEVAATRGGSEATLRVCTRVSPRLRKDGLRIESLALESASGRTTWCSPNAERTSLSCSETGWSIADTAPPRVIDLPAPVVEDARGDTRGPRIHALSFDPVERAIRIRASDESGLGLTQLFVSEGDGVSRLASDWEGNGGGYRQWPADAGASTRGELEIPVRSFRTRGGVLLQGGILSDTVGNHTFFAFDPRKDKSNYVCRSEGSSDCGSKLPILKWLEAENER